MTTSRDDLLDLSDYAWQRLRGRMTGLTDAEYRWQPAESGAVTAMPWRLGHIADFLTEQRNAVWLGLSATGIERDGEPDTAAAALAAVDAAYASWRTLLEASTEETLAAPIGPPAGRYGEATRRSFVLHVLDELIHHGAEAALLRDLYSATR
ncbi:MAG TPA: DinB family protein [Micromonosporaceae bacterium]